MLKTFETHPIDEFYLTAAPPGLEVILRMPLVRVQSSSYLPPGSCGLEPNTSSSCQSEGYQPVGGERPGLANVFPTGVAEEYIPKCTYLLAVLMFTCSEKDLS